LRRQTPFSVPTHSTPWRSTRRLRTWFEGRPSAAEIRVESPLRNRSRPESVAAQIEPSTSSASARMFSRPIAGVLARSKTTNRMPSNRARPAWVPIQM